MLTSIAIRFWAKVPQRGTGCWEWQASMYPSGYGQFRGSADKEGMAHRWAWRLTRGEIPTGKYILHRCDNRRCVRPTHLFLGTQHDNMADAGKKGRIPRGEQRNNHKLTDADVQEIRAYAATHPHKHRHVLLARFPISRAHLSTIVCRRKWRHVA